MAAGTPTGYERVRDILEAAAGDSTADYGGIGRFWLQGRDALVNAAIFGVPMVPYSELSAANTADDVRPGERAGLVRGLRGEPPFDGSRFPRLPWGGKRVPEADICMIADWIDDGCPADTQMFEESLGSLEADGDRPSRIVLRDVAEFEAFLGGVNGYAFRQPETRQRANIDCLPEQQLDELRAAFRAIYDLNDWPQDRRSYNNQALVHQNHCQHGWERFLPWHRAYMYEFEQNLRDFRPDVMVPYWDWTMPQYQPATPDKGWRIPKALQAFFIGEEMERLIHRLSPRPTEGQAKKMRSLVEPRSYFVSQHAVFDRLVNEIGYTDITPAPEDRNRQAVIEALLLSNALWYPLRYPGNYQVNGKPSSINEAIHYHYPSAADIEQILSLNNFRDFGGGSLYNDSFGFLDQNPHNTMHIWTGGMNPDQNATSYLRSVQASAAAPASLQARVTGRNFHHRGDLFSQPAVGDMFSNLTASYDPVFWPVHANVDRLWWAWQQRHPHAVPLDLDAVMSPWSYTVGDMLSIEPFGYEYVRGGYLMPVGLEAPVGRFVSRPLSIPAEMQNFNRAEVRLYRVPQLTRSCFIRVFLNDPAADATTPVEGNPHFAGYLAVFGHGPCYGGPGHCALPPPLPRAGDQRPRSHNTPRNHRIDVTAAARRALATADTLRITLVVIGVDYQEDNDLLKLEGVTLTLLD